MISQFHAHSVQQNSADHILYASEAGTYVKNIEKKKYTDGLKIFRSQELLPVSLETRIRF
jgi:hypothetical protein